MKRGLIAPYVLPITGGLASCRFWSLGFLPPLTDTLNRIAGAIANSFGGITGFMADFFSHIPGCVADGSGYIPCGMSDIAPCRFHITAPHHYSTCHQQHYDQWQYNFFHVRTPYRHSSSADPQMVEHLVDIVAHNRQKAQQGQIITGVLQALFQRDGVVAFRFGVLFAPA